MSQHLCHYTPLENGVHEIVFIQSTRAAVDEYALLLDNIMGAIIQQGIPTSEVLLFMVDLRQSGMPPLAYFSQKAREMFARHTVRYKTRVALLHRPGLLISLLQSFIALLPNRGDAVRFFAGDAREQAVNWLVEVKEKTPAE